MLVDDIPEVQARCTILLFQMMGLQARDDRFSSQETLECLWTYVSAAGRRSNLYVSRNGDIGTKQVP